MGRDREINAVTPQCTDCSQDFWHQLRKLIIDNQHAVIAHIHRNVSAGTKQYEQVIGDFFCGDFSRLEVPAEGLGQCIQIHQGAVLH